MAHSGGQPGNQNARNGKQWRQAIERALEKRGKGDRAVALDALAEKLLEQVDLGDVPAIKEFGDRMDGKSAQSVTVGSDPENPLVIEHFERVIVDPKP